MDVGAVQPALAVARRLLPHPRSLTQLSHRIRRLLCRSALVSPMMLHEYLPPLLQNQWQPPSLVHSSNVRLHLVAEAAVGHAD